MLTRLFPGVAYYITMWYCRHEAQFRQALFFSAASVAGAFSGLLAYGIAHMDGGMCSLSTRGRGIANELQLVA